MGIKIAFLSVFLLLFSEVVVAEDQVIDIAVEGNRYIETPAILAKIKSKTGEALSRRQISKDVRKLFATGYFSEVYTEGEVVSGGIKLIFVVVENPVIASVSIEGNKEIPNKKLRPGMKLKPGFILSPRVEILAANSIRKDYLRKGFYQMDVKIETTMLDDGRVDVLVRVIEGDVTFIKEIRLIGNKAFSHEKLLGALASRASNFGSWFSSRDVFNRDRFEADAQMLRQYYQENGYLDARIESTRLMLTPDKQSFYLAMSIHEGPQYTIGAVALRGDVVPSHAVLLEEIKLEAGDIYAVSKVQATITALTERVGDEGFAFASVTPLFQRNIEKNTVIIDFDIEKGREVYVERIEIVGHTKTKDFVVRRELRQNEGERYHASHVRRSRERLGRLRYMSNVRVSTPRGSTEDSVKMKLDVEEGKSGTFSAGVTYSQLNDLAFTGKVEEQNLFGEGYQANVSADVGGATNNYSVSLTDPYLLSEDVSGSVRLFRSETDQFSLVQYKQSSQGGSVGLGMALNEYARYSVGYSVTKTTLTDVDEATASISLLSQEGTFETGELKQSLSYDTRNRVISATDGSLHTISLGYAGLTGTHKFYELGFSTQNYLPLTDFWTLRTLFNVGVIRGYNGLEAPIYRRYSLGGVGSLRGYDYFGVSLLDPDTLDILGGEFKSTASLDFIFPLPYMESAGFRGAFFIDSGTVWGNSGTVTAPFDSSKLRSSYGLGIEWASPVGPISLIWAKLINAQPNDALRSFEFALGRGF